jgi:hypothetical protein|tara:strand:- start:942 stop:1166 length:225 start_codon:yes stop_codon:yes gene_type:complete
MTIVSHTSTILRDKEGKNNHVPALAKITVETRFPSKLGVVHVEAREWNAWKTECKAEFSRFIDDMAKHHGQFYP